MSATGLLVMARCLSVLETGHAQHTEVLLAFFSSDAGKGSPLPCPPGHLLLPSEPKSVLQEVGRLSTGCAQL